MFCENCGSEIKEGSKFCIKCGEKVRIWPKSDAVSPSYATEQAPKKSHLPVIIISIAAAVAVLAVVIILIVVRSHGRDEEPVKAEKEETVNEQKEESPKEEEAKPSVEEQTESIKSDYDPGWKNAYLDYVDENFPEGDWTATFKLVFIDDNDIPELFISGGSMAAGTYVLTYYNGKTESYYTGEYGADYIERGGLIYIASGHGGGYSDEIVRLENGVFTSIASGEYSEWPDGRKEYYWEGNQLTEEEYNAHISELFDTSKSTRMDGESDDNFSYERLYQVITNWPDADSSENRPSGDDAFIEYAKGLDYINGLGGFFDVYLDPNSDDYKEDLSDIPFGNIDCLIEDFDNDGEDELLVASINDDEHVWFSMYENKDKVTPADQYEFKWSAITCGDNSTHVFCYDHDGRKCIGIFNDVGYGMGVEYCGTLQFTCLKYDSSSFSDKHYTGYVGSDGYVEPEFLNLVNGSGIKLDWEQLEGNDAIENMISVTGGSRFFSILLDVNHKFGEGYNTVWYGGSVEYKGFSTYDFAYANEKDINAWKARKEEREKTYYIIPDSSERLLTEEDLVGLTKEQLRIARNEIPARHGRKFKDKELQAYFDGKPWYTGEIDADYFSDSSLSDTERQNMDFIKKHE